MNLSEKQIFGGQTCDAIFLDFLVWESWFVLQKRIPLKVIIEMAVSKIGYGFRYKYKKLAKLQFSHPEKLQNSWCRCRWEMIRMSSESHACFGFSNPAAISILGHWSIWWGWSGAQKKFRQTLCMSMGRAGAQAYRDDTVRGDGLVDESCVDTSGKSCEQEPQAMSTRPTMMNAVSAAR